MFVKSLPALLLFLGVVALLRCWNYADVFVNGQVYFVDADCYSRMSRVRQIEEGEKFTVRHHDFENHPNGVTPHTTLPMDWTILALAKVVGSRDLAGAVVSPLLGVITGFFLWWWSLRLNLRGRWMLLSLYAVSPILVHGTLLGRPDHQSLILLCVATALGAEWALATQPQRGWALLAGTAWGMGLWVSFYEPLILLALVLIARAASRPRDLWRPLARYEWTALGAVLLVAALSERSLPIAWPDETVREFFPRWKESIGELASVTPLSPLLYQWVGLGLLAAPVLLGFAIRKDRRAIPVLAILLVVWSLTLWQIRWGYFLALIFAMALPLQISTIPKLWPVWIGFVLSLWPVAGDWEQRAFPSEARKMQISEQRLDYSLLREAAESIASRDRNGGRHNGILAPWWLSPPLAYWTGLPCVAGSSHESLSGTVAASRFYLTSSVEEARIILRRRRVGFVLAYEPSRVLQTSASLLGRNPGREPMAVILYDKPESVPPFLQLVYFNEFFKVYRVSELNPDDG